MAKSIWRITAQAPAQSQAVKLGIFYLIQINWASKIVSSAEVRISVVSLIPWHWALSFAKAHFQRFSTVLCFYIFCSFYHNFYCSLCTCNSLKRKITYLSMFFSLYSLNTSIRKMTIYEKCQCMDECSFVCIALIHFPISIWCSYPMSMIYSAFAFARINITGHSRSNNRIIFCSHSFSLASNLANITF